MKSEVPLVFKGNRKFFIQFYASIIEKRSGGLELQKEEVDHTEEVPLEEGFRLIREGKTKFPYEGKEEEFEEIFEAIREFCEKQKERIDEEMCL